MAIVPTFRETSNEVKRQGAALRDDHGFTLVEFAVAALVLGIITAAALLVYIGYVK